MQIIAIANQKGGVGKTTVTMQLAAALSLRATVLVVDVDRQQSTVWWADNAKRHLPFDFAGNQDPSLLRQLRGLRRTYDYVLVDTPGNLEDADVLGSVLDVADFAVVPLTPEPLAVEPTMRTLSRLIEPRHLRRAVLLNRIDPRIPTQLSTWQELLDTTFGIPRFSTHLRQYRAHADAPVLGGVVTSMARTRRSQNMIDDITLLSHELVGLLKPTLSAR